MATITPGVLAGAFDLQLRYNAAAIAGAMVPSLNGVLAGATIRKDIYYGGTDYVAGQVQINGVGKLAFVRIHEQGSGNLVAGGWTDPSGNFSFPNLSATLQWYGVAFDFVSGEQAYVYDQI